MSKHAKDWALTAAVPVLAATGLGAAGIGPLAGLLGASEGSGLLGTFGSMSGGAEGAGVGFGAMNVPQSGLLGGLEKFGGSKIGQTMLANGAVSAMTPQQAPPMNIQTPPQQQHTQLSPEDEYKRRMMMAQAPFAAGAYFNG